MHLFFDALQRVHARALLRRLSGWTFGRGITGPADQVNAVASHGRELKPASYQVLILLSTEKETINPSIAGEAQLVVDPCRRRCRCRKRQATPLVLPRKLGGGSPKTRTNIAPEARSFWPKPREPQGRSDEKRNQSVIVLHKSNYNNSSA